MTVDRAGGGGGAIALIGGGGHAAVVSEAAAFSGWTVAGVFDDDGAAPTPAIEVSGTAIGRLGCVADALGWSGRLIVAIGDLGVRRGVIDRVARGEPGFASVVHPRGWVSPSARVGGGVFVSAGALVNARSVLGGHVIVNTGAVVEHDAEVGEGSHIAPGAVLCGGARVGSDALVGAGAVVKPGVMVGSGAVVGAGAVVLRDVGAGEVVVGSPAVALGARR